MARAHVVTVLPSLASSFKFFEVGEPLGVMEADRSHGVFGRIGGEVSMIPVTVDADGIEYAFRAVRHDVLLSLMTAFLADSSLRARGRTFGDQTVAIELDIDYEDGRSVHYTDSFASASASAEAATMAASLVAYLEQSPFEGPDISAIGIRLRSVERIDTTSLVDAIPERLVVRPGDELRVRLRLRPHRGDEFEHTATVRIPSEAPEGKLDLVVADGASWTVYDVQMRPFRPDSFGDELRFLERLVPNRHVVLALERRQLGVALPGGSLAVPPSLVVQLRSALGPWVQTTEYGVLETSEEEMSTPVLGAQRIPLTVRRARWEDQ
jgi:hypothetical protein